MCTPRIRIPAMLSVVLLIAILIMTGDTAAQYDSTTLPSHLKIVDGAEAESWSQSTGSLASGPVQLVMHLDRAPLAMVGKFWTHEQRMAYVQETMALQDPIIAQVEQAGGTVIGRSAMRNSSRTARTPTGNPSFRSFSSSARVVLR